MIPDTRQTKESFMAKQKTPAEKKAKIDDKKKLRKQMRRGK